MKLNHLVSYLLYFTAIILASTATLADTPRIAGDRVDAIRFEGASIDDALDFYRTLTGRTVICDSSAQGTIDLVTNTTVSRAEARDLMETVLNLNGFSLLLYSDDTAVLLGPGKPTRGVSVPIIYDETKIPDGISVITFIVTLKNIDPIEMANTLNQYLATGQPYTSFLPGLNGKSLMVTETTRCIRQLIPLIRLLDDNARK